MDEKIKLPENVMLIDVAYLNFVIKDMQNYFERALNRQLQVIDFAELVSYLALDADYKKSDQETHVVLVYDKDSAHLYHSTPSDITSDLNGMAYKDQFGEFAFAGVPTEGLTTRGELFIDLLQIAIESKDTKRIVVLSNNEELDKSITTMLNDVTDKEIIQFRMQESDQSLKYRWQFLPYPIMQALGIRGDELN